jgi:hypothetical protein
MADRIDVPPGRIEAAAQTVASNLAQAARVGPVPRAGTGSVVDGAAAAVSGAVIKNVAASSADLAPKSAEVLAFTRAALTGAQTKDGQNAGRIKSVPEGMEDQPQT